MPPRTRNQARRPSSSSHRSRSRSRDRDPSPAPISSSNASSKSQTSRAGGGQRGQGRGRDGGQGARNGTQLIGLYITGLPPGIEYDQLASFVNSHMSGRYFNLVLDEATPSATMLTVDADTSKAALNGQSIAPGYPLTVVVEGLTGALSQQEKQALHNLVHQCYNRQSKSLDLSALQQKGVTFANFHAHTFVSELFNAIGIIAPDTISLNLAQNNIRLLSCFLGMIHVLPQLLNLSLSNNQIARLSELDILSRYGNQLRELFLTGNPICVELCSAMVSSLTEATEADERHEQYQQYISTILPSLKRLDTQHLIPQLPKKRHSHQSTDSFKGKKSSTVIIYLNGVFSLNGTLINHGNNYYVCTAAHGLLSAGAPRTQLKGSVSILFDQENRTSTGAQYLPWTCIYHTWPVVAELLIHKVSPSFQFDIAAIMLDSSQLPQDAKDASLLLYPKPQFDIKTVTALVYNKPPQVRTNVTPMELEGKLGGCSASMGIGEFAGEVRPGHSGVGLMDAQFRVRAFVSSRAVVDDKFHIYQVVLSSQYISLIEDTKFKIRALKAEDSLLGNTPEQIAWFGAITSKAKRSVLHH